MTEVEEQSQRLRLFCRTVSVIKGHFRIEARGSLITPVRFLGQQLSLPVVIEFSITAGKKEQGVLPASFVKDEHLGLRISLRHPCCFSESLLVCSVRIALGIVIEVVAIAMDNEYH